MLYHWWWYSDNAWFFNFLEFETTGTNHGHVPMCQRPLGRRLGRRLGPQATRAYPDAAQELECRDLQVDSIKIPQDPKHSKTVSDLFRLVGGWPTHLKKYFPALSGEVVVGLLKYLKITWLVVSTTPSEKWWTSSVGMMTFPTEWKNKKKCSKPPTSHQSV